jgi:hypothetical protein
MDQETLIKQWYNGIRIMHKSHYEAAKQCENRNRWLSAPTSVLSGLAGIGTFATLNWSPDIWVKILIGFFAIAAAVLAGLQTYFNYSQQAESHQSAAAKYGALRRELEEALMFCSNEKPCTKGFIESFRHRWDALDRDSPTVPQSIRDRAEAQVKESLADQKLLSK